MKNIINNLENLSKWYAIVLVLLYSLLIAEFMSSVNRLSIADNLMNNSIFVIFSRISFALAILSGFVVWIISNFIFHLTALLFNGHSSYKRFLYISSYPYIVQAIMILVGIFLLDGIQVPETENAAIFLMNNSSFKLAMNMINISAIPYYIMIVILIHYIYQIKYLYATLSVVIPIGAIWAITQLFTRIL